SAPRRPRRDLPPSPTRRSSDLPLVPNPAWRLVTARATIRSPSGSVLLPGFYDDVREPDAADLSLLAAIPFDDIRWRDNFGISDRSEEHTSELQSREKLVCRLLR